MGVGTEQVLNPVEGLGNCGLVSKVRLAGPGGGWPDLGGDIVVNPEGLLEGEEVESGGEGDCNACEVLHD
jgi:hypothetical protein